MRRINFKIDSYQVSRVLLGPAFAILISLVIGWLFLAVQGYSPEKVYRAMLEGAFGSTYSISETLVKAIPIMLTALAASLSFKVKLWNIGAEGQLYLGAFAATGIAFWFPQLSPALLLPAMLVAGCLAGVVWNLIPGFLRAFWGINETITTLMFNYLGIIWVDYFIFGPWKDPKSNFPLSPRLTENTYLPVLGDTRVHLGLAAAILVAVLLWWLIKYSKWGYEVRVMGESQESARYAGIDTVKNIVLVMAISGGIAGIAGMTEVAGVTHRLQHGLSPGYGYTGLIVAWLARLNPLAVIVVSFLFGGLLVGGFSAQGVGAPYSLVSILQGLILFFLLGADFIAERYLAVFRQKKKGGEINE
ncbi:MAG: ABC transporter permease [Firmicutes bacterium]|nr:ABC transporter permease [Bacillota bacterium]